MSNPENPSLLMMQSRQLAELTMELNRVKAERDKLLEENAKLKKRGPNG